MLTRARSLFSRVFSSESSTSSARQDEPMKQVNDELENMNRTRANLRYLHPHEKSKQDRLIHSMQIAISRGNLDTIKRLLNSSDININHRDQYGMSYIEHAILMGRLDMVDLFIRYGCDLFQGNSNGHSCLYDAIETTTNKSTAIVRLLLESNCACLRTLDVVTLTSLTQIAYINCDDYLLLNEHLLLIFKYHMRRMALDVLLNLLSYFIQTNLFLCKNDEYYGLDSTKKTIFLDFNHDYISLFLKELQLRHLAKFKTKIQCLPTVSSPSLISLTNNDIQPCLTQVDNSVKHVVELKHLCRFFIRQNVKNLKLSTIAKIVPTVKLQDYLLYTPI
ncbi:unnamed protein product [Adineta ricciae]|uniref:SOCS box domain-containing protein n=1 Tax=Adineta ricciae TaxID=249248 RepID=A0A814UTV3_ADIRI|nr:unnamed protein product [Adineta ricciae]CAF1179541.1 unnamed protein product [Adineta ricciae]